LRDCDEEKGPNRTCVATRQVLPIERLLRFVVDPEGRLAPDIRARLPGRGVWVACERAAVENAIRRKSFARSLKQNAEVPEGLADMVEALLAADARQSLAMANKAGLVVSGFAKAEGLVAKGKAVALVWASDGGEDGRRKMTQVIRRNRDGGEGIPLLSPFPGHEMDLALGRENAIHAALMAGPAADAFLNRCRRLDQFRQNISQGIGPDAEDTAASISPLVSDGQ
jgi:predicted RNA-binding protein YlxR (DUF448 family)